MARRCSLTGKAVQSGNNVSHSNRKTRRRFLPNLQNVSFLSDKLDKVIKLRVATRTIKSVEINGGIDNYLISLSDDQLSKEALKYKNLIKKKNNTNN